MTYVYVRFILFFETELKETIFRVNITGDEFRII